MELENGMVEDNEEASPQGYNDSSQEGEASAQEEEAYAMEVLFKDHNIAMAVACFGALTLGLLLAINMLSQLKAKNDLYFAFSPLFLGVIICSYSFHAHSNISF